MPLALLLIGIVILVTAFRGTTAELGQKLAGEFRGQNNFTVWLVAFAIIGAFSYIPGFRGVANAFFVLVIIAILLAHNGFFEQFQAAVNRTASTTP